MASATGPSHYLGRPIFGNGTGCSFSLRDKGLWFGALGWVVGSILSFPKHFPAGAAQLWEQACLLVTPGQPVGGWLGCNASGIVTS